MVDIYDCFWVMVICMLVLWSKGGRGFELCLIKFEQGEYDLVIGGSLIIECCFDGFGMCQDYDVWVIDGLLI